MEIKCNEKNNPTEIKIFYVNESKYGKKINYNNLSYFYSFILSQRLFQHILEKIPPSIINNDKI